MPPGLLARRAYGALSLIAAVLAVVYALLPVRILGVATTAVLIPHLLYSLAQLGRRRDNAGQVPRLGNWLYSIARWSAPVVTGFLAYLWQAQAQAQAQAGAGAQLLDVPGYAVVLAGVLALAIYLGWACFGAWIELVGLGRPLAARLALVQSALLVASGAPLVWRLARGG